MYYYGYNNASYGQMPCYSAPYNNQGFVGYTQGGYGFGAALWIVLFILLVIIIGAGWAGGSGFTGTR